MADGRNGTIGGAARTKQFGQQIQLQKKILGGPNKVNRLSKSKTA